MCFSWLKCSRNLNTTSNGYDIYKPDFFNEFNFTFKRFLFNFFFDFFFQISNKFFLWHKGVCKLYRKYVNVHGTYIHDERIYSLSSEISRSDGFKFASMMCGLHLLFM